jgi:hypothetical protein
MHRCATAVGLVGYAAWCIVYAVVALVTCVIVVLPFLLLVALDALVGERAPAGSFVIAPPAPPQQPASLPRFTQRAA